MLSKVGWWDEEATVRERGRALDPEVTKLCDWWLDFVRTGAAITQGFPLKGHWEQVVALAWSQHVGSLRLAWEAAFVGYYAQSLSLQRLGLENWALMAYAFRNRKEAEQWIDFPDRSPKTGGELLKALFESDPLTSAKVKGIHDILNRFAHQNPLALGIVYDDSRMQSERRFQIRLGPFTDERGFRDSTYHLVLLGSVGLHAKALWLEQEHRVDQNWLRAVVEYIDYVRGWLQRYRERAATS